MKFIIEGTKYEFDDSRLTFAEARALEKATGRTMGEIGQSGGTDATSLQAMIWVAMKRTDPTLKFSDLDEMSMGDIEFVEEIAAEPESEPDPTAGAEGGPSTPSE